MKIVRDFGSWLEETNYEPVLALYDWTSTIDWASLKAVVLDGPLAEQVDVARDAFCERSTDVDWLKTHALDDLLPPYFEVLIGPLKDRPISNKMSYAPVAIGTALGKSPVEPMIEALRGPITDSVDKAERLVKRLRRMLAILGGIGPGLKRDDSEKVAAKVDAVRPLRGAVNADLQQVLGRILSMIDASIDMEEEAALGWIDWLWRGR